MSETSITSLANLIKVSVRAGKTLRMGGTASLDALTPNLTVPMVNWVEIGLTLFERRYTGQIPSS
ncbi:hypothetical protein D3C81_1775850 [compost metagenome]